ncbi:hypothetical protein [Prauserella endophytica]|uniref:Secreted protein n=1 Tax=Prauserella endophytica TaxID=1592324 RepID=A0ABY2S059_9PSEU|nr:hypothetical protein [Prauserella endophytica]TKG67025.1 hypothetical protein FCN18_24270 [Prauserella endophytica]
MNVPVLVALGLIAVVGLGALAIKSQRLAEQVDDSHVGFDDLREVMTSDDEDVIRKQWASNRWSAEAERYVRQNPRHREAS